MTASPVERDGYVALLAQAKTAVRDAQLRAHLAVNHELIGLYWQLGGLILNRQRAEGLGNQGHRATFG